MSFFQNKVLIDKHGRSLYYDHSSKTAYIIPNSESAKFKLYYYRFVVSVAAFVLSSNYFLIWYYALGASILLFCYLHWYFYNKLMANYAMIKNFDVSSIPNKRKATESKGKSILRMVLYALFGILLIINAHMEPYGLPMVIGSYVVAGFAFLRTLDLLRQYLATTK